MKGKCYKNVFDILAYGGDKRTEVGIYVYRKSLYLLDWYEEIKVEIYRFIEFLLNLEWLIVCFICCVKYGSTILLYK